VDPTVIGLIAEGYLGEVLAIEVRISEDPPLGASGPLHWRQDRDLCWVNTLSVGIWYESLMRWVGPASRVLARTRTFAPWRATGNRAAKVATVPDHVDIVADFACGAVGNLRFTTVAGPVKRRDVYLFGSEGTLYYDGVRQVLYGAGRVDNALREITIQPERKGTWRVERDFVDAIRGEAPVTLTRFEDGVKYMEFTEAVIRSGQTGLALELPLRG